MVYGDMILRHQHIHKIPNRKIYFYAKAYRK
nr:MAG TPA: hypothetical protein [Caudoviricetes sp.]